jgi:hypothetical protein
MRRIEPGRTRSVLVTATAVIALACSRSELRGKSVASPDGKTYLVVDDDNGGRCGPIKVDGQVWTTALHSAGSITPGLHEISCGSSVEFEIRDGATFHFNYWGP